MRRLAMGLATLGGILMLGTAMLAFDAYMSGDRKAYVRAEIDAGLEAKAEQYDERGLACRRKCMFGGFSELYVTFRDGMFSSVPFQAAELIPNAPADWIKEDYTLLSAETLFGREIRETLSPAETNNKHLLHLHKAADSGSGTAVQMYRSGDDIMAIIIDVHRDAIRKAKDGDIQRDSSQADIFAHLYGLPVRTFKKISHDWRDGSNTPVDYQRFEINLDRQVKITIYALADQGDVIALLNNLDMVHIVDGLPSAPIGFDRSDVFAQNAENTVSDS